MCGWEDQNAPAWTSDNGYKIDSKFAESPEELNNSNGFELEQFQCKGANSSLLLFDQDVGNRQ